jgi:hypothetical protein
MLHEGGRRFDSRGGHCLFFFFSLPNPFSCTMAMMSTRPLTEISTRNLSGSKERSTRKAENLSAICEYISSKFKFFPMCQTGL